MLSIVGLTAFNLLVLLRPPTALLNLLELMRIPFHGRVTLLAAAVVNVAASFAFESWGTEGVARAIAWLIALRGERRRVREGKTYKAVMSSG
jgi:cation-transporting P-type ATPase 13A2